MNNQIEKTLSTPPFFFNLSDLERFKPDNTPLIKNWEKNPFYRGSTLLSSNQKIASKKMTKITSNRALSQKTIDLGDTKNIKITIPAQKISLDYPKEQLFELEEKLNNHFPNRISWYVWKTKDGQKLTNEVCYLPLISSEMDKRNMGASFFTDELFDNNLWIIAYIKGIIHYMNEHAYKETTCILDVLDSIFKTQFKNTVPSEALKEFILLVKKTIPKNSKSN